MAQAVTDANFQTEVLDHQGVVLVDLWAEWCTPCKALGPIIEKVAEKYSGNEQVKIVKLDVDENPQIQQKYTVMSIPTMIIFKNGEMVEKLVGLKPQEVIETAIESSL